VFPKNPLEPKKSRFHQRTAMITRPLLPTGPTLPTNPSQVLISGMRRPLPVPTSPYLCSPTRRYPNLHLPTPHLQGFVHPLAIIRTIPYHTHQGPFHLSEELLHHLCIMYPRFRDFYRLYLATSSVYPNMNLAPGAPPTIPMLTNLLFPLPMPFQPAAV